jgi:hypothetical protein
MKEEKQVPKPAQDEAGEVLQKDFEFLPTGQHEYRQRGPYLVCLSCEVQHAVYIGMEKIMVGEDEQGRPILKTRKELGL